MNLSAVGPEAAEALAAIHADAFDRPWSAREFGSILCTPATVGVLAELDGAPVGLVLVRKAADEGEIITLAVRSTARRRGVGRALVEGGSTLLADAGAQTLWLEVAVDNPGAIALYRASGFEPGAVRPGYYDRGDGVRADALVMRRALNMTLA